MNIKEFTLAHQRFCGVRVANKKCRGKRDLKSDRCAHCVVEYLNAQAALETFDVKATVSNAAPKFATLDDAAVRKGLVRLVDDIRNGRGRIRLPIGARPVISGVVFEVVDHDTVEVEGYTHSMTMRVLMTDYHEMPFNSTEKNVRWSESKVREWLNTEFINKLSDPLKEAIVAPKFTTKHLNGDTEELDVTADKIWIPSAYQIGYTGDNAHLAEGDVLDAFDTDISIDHVARRTVAEYHGDEIVPKSYWLRTEAKPEDDGARKVTIVNHMGKESSAEPYETSAMVIPFITIA